MANAQGEAKTRLATFGLRPTDRAFIESYIEREGIEERRMIAELLALGVEVAQEEGIHLAGSKSKNRILNGPWRNRAEEYLSGNYAIEILGAGVSNGAEVALFRDKVGRFRLYRGNGEGLWRGFAEVASDALPCVAPMLSAHSPKLEELLRQQEGQEDALTKIKNTTRKEMTKLLRRDGWILVGWCLLYSEPRVHAFWLPIKRKGYFYHAIGNPETITPDHRISFNKVKFVFEAMPGKCPEHVLLAPELLDQEHDNREEYLKKLQGTEE